MKHLITSFLVLVLFGGAHKVAAQPCTAPQFFAWVNSTTPDSTSVRDTACFLQTVTIHVSVPAPTGYIYKLRRPNGATGNLGSGVVTVNGSFVDGTWLVICWKTADTTCRSTDSLWLYKDNPSTSVTGASILCPNDPLATITATMSPYPGATYIWSGPNGFTQQGAQASVSVPTVPASAGTYFVTATDVVGCVASNARALPMAPRFSDLPFFQSVSSLTCSNSTSTLTAQAPSWVNPVYKWGTLGPDGTTPWQPLSDSGAYLNTNTMVLWIQDPILHGVGGRYYYQCQVTFTVGGCVQMGYSYPAFTQTMISAQFDSFTVSDDTIVLGQSIDLHATFRTIPDQDGSLPSPATSVNYWYNAVDLGNTGTIIPPCFLFNPDLTTGPDTSCWPSQEGEYSFQVTSNSGCGTASLGFQTVVVMPLNETSLPVEMVNPLRADTVDGYILLSWATSLEIDNRGFVVMRSTDAVTWDSIGWVPGYNNSTFQHNYSFSDNDATPWVTYYYQLIQVDNDGDREPSNTASARITSTTEQSVFVTPLGQTPGESFKFEIRGRKKYLHVPHP